jgi:hypothetical protein
MTIAGSAHAVPIPILAPITVSGNAALAIASNSVFLNALGTASLPSNPWGTATLTAVGGGIPSISVAIDSHPAFSTAGGGGSVVMTYHMMYYNPGAPDGSRISGTITTNNVVTQSGASNARTTMTIAGGFSDQPYSAYECVSSNGPFSHCGDPHPLHDGQPFPSGPISLLQNVDYLVRLVVEAAGPDGQAYAFIDPQFSAPLSGGGEFLFSSGITSATPIPAAFPLFATGLGALALLARRRRKQAP